MGHVRPGFLSLLGGFEDDDESDSTVEADPPESESPGQETDGERDCKGTKIWSGEQHRKRLLGF